MGLSVTEPGQIKQKQVSQLRVLEVQKDLREHLHEALDPDAQVSRLRCPVEEGLVLELSVVARLVSLNKKVVSKKVAKRGLVSRFRVDTGKENASADW